MENFLEHYLVYSSGNEVSVEYHKWAGLSVISALIGRKVWVAQGMMARVFPNTYTILVGEPASGKSTAMDAGRFLIQAIGGTNMAPAMITLEAMLKNMGKEDTPYLKSFPMGTGVVTYTQLHITANELTMFLGTEPTKMIGFLTDVYDREVYENITKHKGEDMIRGPYITLLGCMTLSVVESMHKAKMITGGFSRRVFFVEGDRVVDKDFPRPEASAEQIAAKAKCIELGRKIQKVSGEFKWSEEGGEFFDNWYRKIKQPQMRSSTDPVMQRWFRAKDVLLLKIAMLLELANEKPVLSITRNGLEQGLKLLDQVEKKLPFILGGGGRNIHASTAIRLEQFIKSSAKGRTDKEIHSMFYNDGGTEEIASILQHLVTAEKIKATNIQIGRLAKTGYVTVEDLTSPASVVTP